MNSSTFDAALFHLMFLVLPFVMGSIHCLWRKNAAGFSKSECFLAYFLIIAVGIQSSLVGYFEIFHPERIVAYTGWQLTPLITEIGMSHVAFGILGILSYWFKNGWRSATGVGYSLYLLMAAHFHTHSTHNISPTLWSDIAIPVCIFSLLILNKLRGNHA